LDAFGQALADAKRKSSGLGQKEKVTVLHQILDSNTAKKCYMLKLRK